MSSGLSFHSYNYCLRVAKTNHHNLTQFWRLTSHDQGTWKLFLLRPLSWLADDRVLPVSSHGLLLVCLNLTFWEACHFYWIHPLDSIYLSNFFHGPICQHRGIRSWRLDIQCMASGRWGDVVYPTYSHPWSVRIFNSLSACTTFCLNYRRIIKARTEINVATQIDMPSRRLPYT